MLLAGGVARELLEQRRRALRDLTLVRASAERERDLFNFKRSRGIIATIFVKLMTSDRQLKASKQGSK